MVNDLLMTPTPKIEDQPLGQSTRKVATNAHFQHSVTAVLGELFKVMQPNNHMELKGSRYAVQVGHAASLLAQEYQAVTGYPVLDMLVEKGVVKKPEGGLVIPAPAQPVGTDVAREELGALKLDDD